MSKEKYLSVLIPIKDSDCESTVYASLAALQTAVPASASNTNKIYKVSNGTYYRSTKVSASSYSYQSVVDREFPYLGQPMEIFDFTYDATRMGTAPTISAQGVMRFADSGNTTLDGLWSQECHVVFNGEKMYLKQIPTSSKSNEDARYRYDMDFVSERVVLESVYMYDVTSPFVDGKPISESSVFSFYGDINELAKRINASLIRSGLATLVRKHVNYPSPWDSIEVPYLTYEQWNTLVEDPQKLIDEGVFQDDEYPAAEYEALFYLKVYLEVNGYYNMYLMDYIYENDNGSYESVGYKCIIGKDKYGETASSEEKMVSMENNTIHEALQRFHDTFELDYYITKETDGNGDFTGNTLIVVGDCENDFADWDYNNDDYVRNSDGIPKTSNPFDYGALSALLSKEKTNTTDKIVTRITGVGSSENIPWHYPNPTPDGWLKPVFKRSGQEVQGVTVDYPTSEGDTAQEQSRYEKFLKNRIGIAIKYGRLNKVLNESNFNGKPSVTDYGFYVDYEIGFAVLALRRLTFSFSLHYESGCTRFKVQLINSSLGSVVDEYDSNATYQSPTQFQTMCENRNGKDFVSLSALTQYKLRMMFYVSSTPYSSQYDYEGYYYGGQIVPYSGPTQGVQVVDENAYIGQNFYRYNDLTAFANWELVHYPDVELEVLADAGYKDSEGKVAPIPRSNGKKYKNIVTGVIYKCTTSSQANIKTGAYQEAFEANPSMDFYEWISAYPSMTLSVYVADGWSIGNKQVTLSDYGLSRPMDDETPVDCDIFDTIEFKRVKYLTPQKTLMPEVYIKTDGERRFYDAHNYYPLQEGTADAEIGEVQSGDYVTNPLYKENETDTDDKHYEFETEYLQQHPHEHIENFEDVKPTIKGQTNTVDNVVLRIDVVEEFAYDLTDNDEIWESGDEGNIQGEYKHPYFFAKLRPLGFNIFDMALQEDMVLSMTTGNCGACNFKIGVDENTKKNPVQLWLYDVYGGDTYATRGEKIYSAGELRRYVQTQGLYYDTNQTQEGYVPVKTSIGTLKGGEQATYPTSTPMFERYVYDASAVENGEVGTMKQDGRTRFEGDVVTDGRFIDSQQDTTENYVWVALMKDTDTYGVLMPSAVPNSIYIDPKGINYTNRATGETSALTEDQADKFVITNIKLPQIYLRRAEHELSRKLVGYMYNNNYQKFNFSVRFGRIFIAENPDTDEKLNENSVVYVSFNNATYRQYVKHYSYRMSHDVALPEINVDMNEELSVSRTMRQEESVTRKNEKSYLLSSIASSSRKTKNEVYKNTIGKNESVVMSGDIIVRGMKKSLVELTKNEGEASLEWIEF